MVLLRRRVPFQETFCCHSAEATPILNNSEVRTAAEALELMLTLTECVSAVGGAPRSISIKCLKASSNHVSCLSSFRSRLLRLFTYHGFPTLAFLNFSFMVLFVNLLTVMLDVYFPVPTQSRKEIFMVA